MQPDKKDLDLFKKWIDESNNIVFFGGAGVSTESGIPDFRSVDGLYHQKYDYPPETILSHSFFIRNTKEFYKFYKDKMLVENAKPNITHIKLAELEKSGKLSAVVTQNIDSFRLAGRVIQTCHNIRQRAARRFMSFTALLSEIIAKNVTNSTTQIISKTVRAFLSANAVVSSNLMWFCMRKVLTI